MKNFNKNIKMTILAVLLIPSLVGPMIAFSAGPAIINLGSASDFVILAKTGISTTGTTSIVGDLGISPAAASYITGFNLILPTASQFSTSALVTGKIYAPGYASPTPVKMTTAISDMQTAYTSGAGRTNPTATELGAGNIGGMTLAPGLYKWSTGLTIPTDVTLSGSANDVWIFQIAQNLNISSTKKVILSSGARAENIFWIVAGQTTIGTGATFNGNILDQTAIVLNTGASLIGRALAQTAVTLDANKISTVSENSQHICDYITPAQGCTYIPGPSYNPTTYCGMVLSCPNSNSNSGSNNSSGNSGGSITLPQASLFGQTVSSIAGTLKKGSMGDFVKSLQEFLISQNVGGQAMINYGLDGRFGSVTKAALIEWQMAHSLIGDGILGPKTKAKIFDLGL
ncbi:MAG: ice-binding family protein [Candidatus Paceibacterota bacterium]|jgi:hypothetical protein